MRHRLSLCLLALTLPAVPAPLVAVAPRHEEIARQMAPAARFQLENLSTFSASSLAELGRAAEPAAVAARIRELDALGNPSIGARPLDAEGRAPVHRHLLATLERLAPHGVEVLGSLRALVPVPVPVDRDGSGRAGWIEVGGESLPVHPLWPNGPMPSLAPRGGLTGRLVDAGRASWDDLRGLDLDGAIVLVDFAAGRDFERAFALGAQAVVAVEDDLVNNENAERWFLMTPLPYPRFFATREVAAALRAHAAAGATARLQGGHVLAPRPVETLFAWLPPSPPRRVPVTAWTLAELIAMEHGLTARDLLAANDRTSPILAPGDVLRLPGGRGRVTVREGELADRLARLYGTPLERLLEANPPLRPGGPAEFTLEVPPLEEPIVLVAPVEAVSVAPGLPHGGRMWGNLAVALTALEQAATSTAVRRRGLLVAFTDGDTQAGLASRTLAEYSLRARGQWTARLDLDRTGAVARYQAAADFFTRGTVDPSVARWLADEWLGPRLEEARIRLAEARVPLVLQLTGAAPATAPPGELASRREAIEDEIAALVAARDRSLGKVGAAPAARLEAWWREWADERTAAMLATHGLDREALGARFRREREEEQRDLAIDQGNLEFAGRLLDRLGVRRPAADGRPLLGWYFDFSDASPTAGIVSGGSSEALRGAIAVGSLQSNRTAGRLRQAVAVAAQVAGWREDFLFVAGEDRVVFPRLRTKMAALYDEFWLAAGIGLLPVGTVNDNLDRVDSPADVAGALDPAVLAVHARTAALLLRLALENPADGVIDARTRPPEFSRLVGRAVQFNLRSGLDARDPVPAALLYLPFHKDDFTGTANANAYRGFRRAAIVPARMSGLYQAPLELAALTKRPRVYGYALDPDAAVFNRVVNEGQVGTQQQRNDFSYLRGRDTEKNLVFSPVYPRVIFPGTDPMTYRSVAGEGRLKLPMRLVDAVLDGPPREFAIDSPFEDFNEKDTAAITLYVPPGRRVRAITQFGLEYRLLLVGPVEPGERGRGHLVGPTPEGGRNLLLPLTPLQVADEMVALGRDRLRIYGAYGVNDRALDAAFARAAERAADAHAAAGRREWQEALGAAREAWGIAVKNYPRVLRLGREAVFSVIVLMAALVPAAWFLEQLLIGARGIVARLAGAVAIAVAGTLFLNWFHPAFQIALSPLIVVIAFTMILMSGIVLGLCYGRFDVLLREFRHAGGEVEGGQISLGSALATAFALGVANLKRRPGRTALTAFTVSVLAFSIVAFVSVRGRDTVLREPVPLDRNVEGRQVEPLPPAYDGILLRSFQWQELSEGTIESLRLEFGQRLPLTVRGHYIEAEGGNQADREGVNQIPVEHRGRSAVLTAIQTFMPNEPEFSGLQRAVTGGQWFRDDRREGDRFVAGDRWHVILPAPAAAELGITASQILDADGHRRPDAELPEVQFANRTWRVIGLLDPELANRIRDINGRSLAVVDYLRSAMNRNVGGQLENEGESYHLDWAQMIVVPHAAMAAVQARPRSVALKFPPGFDQAAFFADLAIRLNTPMFAAADGRVDRINLREQIQFAGAARLVVPVVLCILIVMNTMMGTVDERRGEVAMLGAIGLSPRQISFLLMAEATVFSLLALVLGTFGGLLFANALSALHAGGSSLLAGISFNFTSLVSMLLATATGVVVLLATLVPARKAAALAAPSGMAKWSLPPVDEDRAIRFALPFTLTRGNALGMLEFFHQFLARHAEPTSPDFNCRQLRITRPTLEDGGGHTVSALLWLAPYDLDVSQFFQLRIVPSGRSGIFTVELLLRRLSGNEEAWLRTNHVFLDLVRRQFLLWRNLDAATRERFIDAGRTLAGSAPVEAPAS